MNTTDRYIEGSYDQEFGDASFKAKHLVKLLARYPDLLGKVQTYADVGCGDGTVFAAVLDRMLENGFQLRCAKGYEVSPLSDKKLLLPTFASIIRQDFIAGSETYDLISLIDVVEHLVSPSDYLRAVSRRSNFALLHIPLDDRLSVYLAQQWNFRLQNIGHLSFWNPASALSMLTNSALEPLACSFTPGFLAPSGRVGFLQKLFLPIRWGLWTVSPGITARTMGGVSMAVLCRCST
jgi:hypothetical protein